MQISEITGFCKNSQCTSYRSDQFWSAITHFFSECIEMKLMIFFPIFLLDLTFFQCLPKERMQENLSICFYGLPLILYFKSHFFCYSKMQETNQKIEDILLNSFIVLINYHINRQKLLLMLRYKGKLTDSAHTVGSILFVSKICKRRRNKIKVIMALLFNLHFFVTFIWIRREVPRN